MPHNYLVPRCVSTYSPPSVKASYGDEYVTQEQNAGLFAFDDWRDDPEAAMFIADHGIDDEWYHCIVHLDPLFQSRALHTFEYLSQEQHVLMVSELSIEEVTRDLHITSTILIHSTVSPFPILSSPWIFDNLTLMFGHDWQMSRVNNFRFRPSGLFASHPRAQQIGMSTLNICKQLLLEDEDDDEFFDWGHAYVIVNV